MMQENNNYEQTEVSPPPETPILINHQLPSNPIQPVASTWTSNATEYEFPWHPAEDVTELEETLDQAVAHLKKVLKRVGNCSNVDVIKARAFLEQFTQPQP
jgi:enamine deaminase RidA (YjgF/YER057c/UK114 family)